MSTAAVQRVPYPWVTQTRPGGSILTPWGTPYHNGALASFTVNGDGTAEGRIVGNVAFMFLRDQRIYASIDDEECDETTARASHTSVAPYSVAGDFDACLPKASRSPSPKRLRFAGRCALYRILMSICSVPAIITDQFMMAGASHVTHHGQP